MVEPKKKKVTKLYFYHPNMEEKHNLISLRSKQINKQKIVCFLEEDFLPLFLLICEMDNF